MPSRSHPRRSRGRGGRAGARDPRGCVVCVIRTCHSTAPLMLCLKVKACCKSRALKAANDRPHRPHRPPSITSAYLCGFVGDDGPRVDCPLTVPQAEGDDGGTMRFALTVPHGSGLPMRFVVTGGRWGRWGRSIGTLLTPNLQLPATLVRPAPHNEHPDLLERRCQAVELFGELVGLLGPVPGALYIVPNPFV